MNTFIVGNITKDVYLVDGKTSIEKLEKTLGISLPTEEDYGNDTVAGWVLEHLETIPEEGEQIVLPVENGFEVSVEEMDDHRISKVKISKSEIVE